MSIDFGGTAVQNRDAANLIVESGGYLVIAIKDYRDAIENRLKEVLTRQGTFNDKEDMHHSLYKLAVKAGPNLDPSTLLFLQDEKSFQHTKKVNIGYEGTSVAISYETWVSGNNDLIERELKEKVMRCREVCDIIWRETENLLI